MEDLAVTGSGGGLSGSLDLVLDMMDSSDSEVVRAKMAALLSAAAILLVLSVGFLGMFLVIRYWYARELALTLPRITPHHIARDCTQDWIESM